MFLDAGKHNFEQSITKLEINDRQILAQSLAN